MNAVLDWGRVVCLLSLGALVFLRAPKQRTGLSLRAPRKPQQPRPAQHVHLRIGLLGLCLAGLAHSLTSGAWPAVLATAFIIWAPLPYLKWLEALRARQREQELALRARAGPEAPNAQPGAFKQVFRLPPLHAVCPPCTTCAPAKKSKKA